MAPKGPKSILYKHSHVAHINSKVMKSRIQWGKTFAPGACLGSLEVKTYDFDDVFF